MVVSILSSLFKDYGGLATEKAHAENFEKLQDQMDDLAGINLLSPIEGQIGHSSLKYGKFSIRYYRYSIEDKEGGIVPFVLIKSEGEILEGKYFVAYLLTPVQV